MAAKNSDNKKSATSHVVKEVRKTEATTFDQLCKELGRNLSHTDNALLCHRCRIAYNAEHPEAVGGQDAHTRSFRKAAALASGLSAVTIDALLQVGQALATLPAATVKGVARLPLNVLRKLSTSENADKRETMIADYMTGEKADAKTAANRLKQQLGMKPSAREGTEAVILAKEEHWYMKGEHCDITYGKYLVRVEIKEVTSDGRCHLALTMMNGKKTAVSAFLDTDLSSVPKGKTFVATLEPKTNKVAKHLNRTTKRKPETSKAKARKDVDRFFSKDVDNLFADIKPNGKTPKLVAA